MDLEINSRDDHEKGEESQEEFACRALIFHFLLRREARGFLSLGNSSLHFELFRVCQFSDDILLQEVPSVITVSVVLELLRRILA